MKYRRRQRWLRRFALGIAFATVAVGGRVAPAYAQLDEGGSGSSQITAGGWSGQVDESGIPVSAGIPSTEEQLQVIPYLSHGILTQAQADALSAPSGDELAFRNAIADPFLTDVFVRPGESQGGPDGGIVSHAVLGELVKSQTSQPFRPGVTDFPATGSIDAATRPDDRADRYTVPANPPVISYLSHGMGNAGGEVGARPDDRSDRFAHSDVAPQPALEVSGSTDWTAPVTFGIGALVIVLALGLGLGYLRRPRLAGL